MSATQLPPSVAAKIRGAQRRDWTITATRGLFISLTTFIVIIGLAMALDWVIMPIAIAARVTLTTVALTIIGITFAMAFVRRALQRQRIEQIALQIDQQVPQLEERWSTVTELSASDDPPAMRGSDALIDQVSREAQDMVDEVDVDQVVSAQSLGLPTGVLAAALLLSAVIAASAWPQISILWRRFWSPTQRITMTTITSPHGEQVVARHEPVMIEASIAGRRHDRATLLLREDDTVRSIELPATADDASRFEHRIHAAATSFDYRLRCGDDQTDWQHVTVVDRPQIAQVSFSIVAPAYTKLPADQRESLPRRVRAVESSAFEVAFAPTKPVESLAMNMGDESVALALSADERGWYRYRTTLAESLAFSVHLIDAYGLTNTSPPSCAVTVYPDRPPSAAIVSPDDVIAVRPDDTVTVEFEARDDFGIETAELLLTLVGSDEQLALATIPIDLAEQPDSGHVSGKVDVDLSKYNLAHGAAVDYTVRVTDTRQAVATSRMPTSDTSPTDDAPSASAPSDIESSENESQSASAPSEAESSKNEASSSPPPGNEMTKRMLDVPGVPGQSQASSHRLEIDEWAGFFEDQARKKLQFAIDKYLQAFDAALAAAQEKTGALLVHVEAEKPWANAQDESLGGARQDIDDARQPVAELKRLSRGTPYAFIGLQLEDITASHVMPAVGHLADAAEHTNAPAPLRIDLDRAKYHIDRARQQLANLTRQYEQVKRQEAIADAFDQLAKMHQLFIEDMPSMLGADEPSLNPRDPRYKELTDEQAEAFIKKLGDFYERYRALLEGLAEALADDPELLRRFMRITRLHAATIRDQLTILAERQMKVAIDARLWAAAPVDDASLTRRVFRQRLARAHNELADMVALMHDDVVIWTPPGRITPPLREAHRAAGEAARQARLANRLLYARDDATVGEAHEQLMSDLALVDYQLLEAMPLDLEHNDRLLQFYVAERKRQVVGVIERLDDWQRQFAHVEAGEFPQAVRIDQQRMIRDTTEYVIKLKNVKAMLAKLPREIKSKAEDLVAAVERDVIGAQRRADAMLERQLPDESLAAQRATHEAFAQAEKVFDELLTLIEEELMKRPPKPGVPHLPSLEELLAMLENEWKACEKLGLAAMLVNIQLMMDGIMPGGGGGIDGGKGAAGSGASNQRQPYRPPYSQLLRDLAMREGRAAREHARAASEQMDDLSKSLRPGGPVAPSGLHRDWATVVSELGDEMKQSRRIAPPDHYRRAIDRYFETITQPDQR
jgi:hypothetical protein